MKNSNKKFAAAADRNKTAILRELQNLLREGDRVLELGAGTGQHACFFASALPAVIWQPTELPAMLPVIQQWLDEEGSENVSQPIALDVRSTEWPRLAADVVYTCNTLHIVGVSAIETLFAGVGKLLEPGGKFCAYGPFLLDGEHTAPSNRQFDEMLRMQDPEQGVRDMQWLDSLAAKAGLQSAEITPMPKNNCLAVWSCD